MNFALSRRAADLREFWRIEVIRKDNFSWRRVMTNMANNRRRNFIFWWRLASEMYEHGTKRERKAASRLNDKLKERFATDIELGARIGPGFHISHHAGLVISKKARIGRNFIIRQNTTIGSRQGLSDDEVITIGDNVDVGANSCIIGAVTIGDNVTLGAMSFVNKDIPSNSVYITRKTSTTTITPAGLGGKTE